jgi:hypothetical protein
MEGTVTQRELEKNNKPIKGTYKSKVYRPILFSVLT